MRSGQRFDGRRTAIQQPPDGHRMAVCLKRCGRPRGLIVSKNRQNWSYPRVLVAISKYDRLFSTFQVLREKTAIPCRKSEVEGEIA